MTILRKFVEFWPEFAARLTARTDREPISDIRQLRHFVATRSAFVAQKTLYGYLKTRMGTRYPSMFEDDQMIASIDIAKMHVYSACVADLSVFCIAHAVADVRIEETGLRELCLDCHDYAVSENVGGSVGNEQRTEWRLAFVSRLEKTDWPRAANDAEYGLESPRALLEWAPIAPELKKLDVEIVTNSVRFAWHEVRAQFRKRCDTESFASMYGAGE